MLEPFEDEIAARFTFMEFMLEVLMARHLAVCSPAEENMIVSELTRLKKHAHSSTDDIDSDHALRVLARSGDLQDHFLEKAQTRAAQIRRATGR